jgi:hypothetical protein
MIVVYSTFAVFGFALLAFELLLTIFWYSKSYGGSRLNLVQEILALWTEYLTGIAFFGAGGYIGTVNEMGTTFSLLLATVGGVCPPLVLVLIRRLNSEGVRIKEAAGKKGVVVQAIPPQGVGLGLVLLQVGKRKVKYQAFTSEQGLPAGVAICVAAVLDAYTVEVKPEVDYAGIWQTFLQQPVLDK